MPDRRLAEDLQATEACIILTRKGIKRRRYLGERESMRPAIFVQDIQNYWLYEPESNQALRDSVEKRLSTINDAIDWFREHGHPVIVGYTKIDEDGLVPGTTGYEVPKTVHVEEKDFKVTKRHASAFANPELGARLKEEGCDTIVIVGLSASGCVLATYFTAFDWDVKPYLLKGGVASHNEGHIRCAEDICDTLSLKEIEDAFK
jgi:nicotinamidase-related amidase